MTTATNFAFAPDALADQVILITGGAQGLGAGTAEVAHAAGATVIITDRNEQGAVAKAAELGARALGFGHDVTSEEDWARVAAEATERFGGLDGLVNNAGIHQTTNFEDLSVAEFERSMAVNVTGVFLGIRTFAGAVRGDGGSIVNLSSVRGLVSAPGLAAYSAAKFGVRGLTRAAAVELGPRNIRVNSICPGTIESEMMLHAMESIDVDAYRGGIPLGRFGHTRAIGDAVIWLLSSASTYVTGIDIPVDGGTLATGNNPKPRVV